MYLHAKFAPGVVPRQDIDRDPEKAARARAGDDVYEESVARMSKFTPRQTGKGGKGGNHTTTARHMEVKEEASEAANEGIDKDNIRSDIEALKGTMRGMNEWELASMRARVRAKGSSTATKLMDALQKPLPKPRPKANNYEGHLRAKLQKIREEREAEGKPPRQEKGAVVDSGLVGGHIICERDFHKVSNVRDVERTRDHLGCCRVHCGALVRGDQRRLGARRTHF